MIGDYVSRDLIVAIKRRMAVAHRARELLGDRASQLLLRQGKVMSGPDVGRYMSHLSCEVLEDLVERLAHGETVSVHLMHRHRSGCHEASSLRLSKDGLVMVFEDREVLA